MKKPLKITLLVMLALGFAIVLVFMFSTKPVKLGSTEKITLNYVYGYKDIHVEITDGNDFAQLISICGGRTANGSELPSCGFGTAELIFESKDKSTAIYPACDRCGTMRLGKADKYFYGISDKDRRLLEDILAKYGATFPCV